MDLTFDEIRTQSGYGQEIDIRFEDTVAIIEMKRGENRSNMDFIERFHKALDVAERNKECTAVITTGCGKFYSNGLDLEWLNILRRRDPKLVEIFTQIHVPNFINRLSSFPIPLIAVLNGHTYAQGAVIALLHDMRIMRKDRGWFCFNEVHVGIEGELAAINIVRRRLPGGPVFHDTVVLGHRYTGPQAFEAGIVHKTGSQDQILKDAIDAGKALKIPRENLRNMKEAMYPEYKDEINSHLSKL